MTTGATQIQELVLGRISLGVTTLKRLGSKDALVDEGETKIMIAVMEDNLNTSVFCQKDKVISFADCL
jgi:hypothetical protein